MWRCTSKVVHASGLDLTRLTTRATVQTPVRGWFKFRVVAVVRVRRLLFRYADLVEKEIPTIIQGT